MLTELLTNPFKKPVWLWISTSTKWSLSKTNPTSNCMNHWMIFRQKHLATHIETPFLDAHRFGWITLGPPLAPVTQPHPNGSRRYIEIGELTTLSSWRIGIQHKSWGLFCFFFDLERGASPFHDDFLVDWLVCYVSCHVWVVFCLQLGRSGALQLKLMAFKKNAHKKQDWRVPMMPWGLAYSQI